MCFSGIGEMAKNTFGAIGDLIKAAFNLDGDGIKAALNRLKTSYSDYGKNIGRAFNDAYDAEMSKAADKSKAKKGTGGTPNTSGATVPEITVPSVNPTGTTLSGASGTGGSGSGSDGGGKIKNNITINIEKLVERFEIHSATVGESAEQIKAVMLETLMGALNDTQLAI